MVKESVGWGTDWTVGGPGGGSGVLDKGGGMCGLGWIGRGEAGLPAFIGAASGCEEIGSVISHLDPPWPPSGMKARITNEREDRCVRS